MNYTWEAVLAADKQNIDREKLRFRPVGDGSPYTEIIRENLNESGLEQVEIGVNPLYRFSGEFEELFNPNINGMEKVREIFFDISMHYFSLLDLRQGMDKQEYAITFLFREILAGIYGEEAREAIKHIPKDKLRHLLRLILKLYRCGTSVQLFREVMRYLYPDSFVYVQQEEIERILIYIGTRKTHKEEQKMDFLQSVFLPMSTQIFLFWEYHFGIIDIEETMELDNMVLF